MALFDHPPFVFRTMTGGMLNVPASNSRPSNAATALPHLYLQEYRTCRLGNRYENQCANELTDCVLG